MIVQVETTNVHVQDF